ncbi:MAG: TetR/AcrR family transcriptional regulator [Chitinophagales bacterium]
MPLQKANKYDVIKQALSLFRVQGYHKTTMSDIGNACGLLKGSIYHYFTSKEDLMRSVLEVLRDHYRDKVFVFAYDEKLSAKQKLNLLGEKCIDVFANGEGACLMANIAMETNDVVPEFRKPIKEFFDDWVQALTHIYKERYSEDAALFFARETVCAIEGAAMMMRIYNDKNYLYKAQEMIMEKFEKASKEALIS